MASYDTIFLGQSYNICETLKVYHIFEIISFGIE